MPKIMQKEAMIIAGVAGRGDATGKAWEDFAKIQKMHPLKNQVGEEGYEVRFYPSEGIGKVHVGVQVKDVGVPAEYNIFYLPAATYAEFEIYPSKGYESSNAEIRQWLEDNAGTYKETLLDGMHCAVEVYDKRFRGDNDPASVVGIMVAIAKIDASVTENVLEILGLL